jgi:FK506-binding protein 2
MMGIEGVPKPESIATKSATDEGPASSASEKVAEKIASVVSEAAEVVKTMVADTDDVQEHNEL